MTVDPHDEYRSPLGTRYAGEPMRRLFSERRRIRTWRQLWIWLAEAERELGLPVTAEQVEALRAAADDIDFDKAAAYEARFRHDVMAHVHAYGDAAPSARGVIHLGATSCYVTDNADALLCREALGHVALLLVDAVRSLSDLARRHAATPCLAYTHFQPAQPTTVGKRVCLWIQDLLDDLRDVEERSARTPFLGSKGTTGTQASFLTLFEGDAERCERLDLLVAEKAGFERPVAVSGQTYSRKHDYALLSTLGGIAVSATKVASDVRLLSGLGEMAEPFETEQIGSSAMAYKQNPMRSERMASLARHLLALAGEAAQMAAAQWLERTLDDSAGRRIVLAEGFLTADGVLRILCDVARGLRVNEQVARARLAREIPFLATEEILMRSVKAGADRQSAHERIRRHSLAAKEALLQGAAENDLIERLRKDPLLEAVQRDLDDLLAPERFTGLARRQTERFLEEEVGPRLAAYQGRTARSAELRV